MNYNKECLKGRYYLQITKKESVRMVLCLSIPQYCVKFGILSVFVFLSSSAFTNTNEVSASSRVSSDQFQPYPEYGFVRKEYQSQYFTVALTGGSDYTFDLYRANVSQRPINVNLAPGKLGSPFLEIFNPDGSVAMVRRQMQRYFDECYFRDSDPGCLPHTLTASETGIFKLRVNGYRNDHGGFALAVTNTSGQQLLITPFEKLPDIRNLAYEQLPGFNKDTSLWRIKNEDYLTRANNVDVWTFTANKDDFVQIQLDMIAPFPDDREDLNAGKLFLFDQNFNLIVSDEGYVPFGNARILSSLPFTGKYYIAVTPLGEYDDDYCIKDCGNLWGDDRVDGLVGGIGHYELDTEIKLLPYKSVPIANDKSKAVKINAIIITNDITLDCDCWTLRDGTQEKPTPTEQEIKDLLTSVNSEFFELYSGDHWDGFELARISTFYSPEYVETKRTDAILYDFANLPVAREGHINLVFARLSDWVHVTGSTFLNGNLSSRNGATLVIDAYKSPGPVLIHELGHVIGIKHVAGAWPPAVMALELSDQSLIGYTGLDHSNPEQSYMSTWIPYANEPGYENKSRFLTEQSFTLNTPTYGRLFSKALRHWLIRNQVIDVSSPGITSYQGNRLQTESKALISPTGRSVSVNSPRIWESITAGPDSGSSPYQHGIFPTLGLSSLPDGTSASAAIWEDGSSGDGQPKLSYKGSDGVWGATTTFATTSGSNVAAHQIEMDGNGNALAIWEPLSNKGIEVVAHNGADWGTPETISLSSTGNNYRSDLAMNKSGIAAAVWLSRKDASSSNLPPSVMFSYKNTEGLWSAALSLIDGTTAIEDPSVSINTNGDILVTWQQISGSGAFAIKGRYRDANAEAWGDVETYSDISQILHGGFAESALDINGNAIITWRQANAIAGEKLSSKGNIMARYRQKVGGTLGAIAQLSANGHDAFNRSVELDRKTVAFLSNNRAVTTWYAFDGTDFRVYAAEMDAQLNWGTAIPLSVAGQHAKLPNLDVDGRANGSVGISWIRSNGIHKIVQFSRKSISSSSWTTPLDLSPQTETAFWPIVKMDGLYIEAMWSRFNGTNLSMSSIVSRAEDVDTDDDGILNSMDTDDDGDGVADGSDAFPLDSAETLDTDGDGTGNNADTDDDGDGVADGSDAFPLDSTETLDTDSDGTGNNADTDDDGDGVADGADAFPLDSAETLDTDSDGTGNNADTDDDGDGVLDGSDAYPLISLNGLTDTDLDGLPNDCDATCLDAGMTADTDDDGDGVSDDDDAFSLDSSETVDSDFDGVGDNSDPFPNDALYSIDSDSDGMPDEWETRYGLDPNDPSDAMSDQDNDGITALDEFLAGTIPSGSLDIDGNENYDALTDGLLLLRGMFGLDGSALITGTIASDATYTESVDIESRIEILGDLADIDGNGEIDALTDGLLTLRYLFGLEGDTLIAGVVASDATRTTAVEIEAHLKTLMPAL